MISSCCSCIQYQNKQQKETLIQHDIPKQVWTKVGTDLFSIFNQNVVIVVDYTSKFFEVSLLPNTLKVKQLSVILKTYFHVMSWYPRNSN